ncbi:MAG: GntR family transcriptional regulator [Clostridium sp.]
MLDSGIQPGRKKADKIYNWLRAYIDENKFSSNQRLPSENELCRRLDVSRETGYVPPWHGSSRKISLPVPRRKWNLHQ